MDQRLANFEALKEHAWLHRIYARLNAQEMELALGFLRKNTEMDKGEFELAVNRMFIDGKLGKLPRHWKEVMELLCCANSALK